MVSGTHSNAGHSTMLCRQRFQIFSTFVCNICGKIQGGSSWLCSRSRLILSHAFVASSAIYLFIFYPFCEPSLSIGQLFLSEPLEQTNSHGNDYRKVWIIMDYATDPHPLSPFVSSRRLCEQPSHMLMHDNS